MSLVKWGFISLLLLPVVELGTFFLVVALIGWLPAIVLFIGSSVVGVLLLRRSGRADFDRLRAAFAQEGPRAVHLETPGLAAMFGGILLVFPGFVTDILGAALLLPAVRRWAVRAIAKTAKKSPGSNKKRPNGNEVLDLEPSEWRQLPDGKRKRRRKPNGGA